MLSDPTWRAVREDELRERGDFSLGAWRLAMGIRFHTDTNAYANANAYAYADANADADAYADTNANAYADAHADAYADADANANANANAYANANADADADAYADADKQPEAKLSEDTMKNGLYAVQLHSGNLVVLRVGWFKRESGDDWEVAWTTPYRGEYQTKLSDVWANGPKVGKSWTWGPVLESAASRFHFVPLARLDPKQWTDVCPKPKGWDE
jgi:hypothetical protein